MTANMSGVGNLASGGVPVDDSTQQQILKLYKERGELSKEKAVLT